MRATIFKKTAKIANTESSVKIGIEVPNTSVESTYMTSDVIHNTKWNHFMVHYYMATIVRAL